MIIIIGLSHRVPLSTKGNIGNFGEQTWLSQFLSFWTRIWICKFENDWRFKYSCELNLANKHWSEELKLNKNIGKFGKQTWLSQFLSFWTRIWICKFGNDWRLKYSCELNLANKHWPALHKGENIILEDWKN